MWLSHVLPHSIHIPEFAHSNAANKSDLEDKRQVKRDAGESLAKKFGCPYVETSTPIV